MLSDREFKILITGLAALPTILLAGLATFWSWRRDQERIIVQKSPVHWRTLDGSQNENTLTGIGILVRNLSLYPVRIVGLGFLLDGKTLLALDRQDIGEEAWPLELASHARMLVRASETQWTQLKADGHHRRIMDWKFVAVAVTETGHTSRSDRLSVCVFRPYRWIKNMMKRGPELQ